MALQSHHTCLGPLTSMGKQTPLWRGYYVQPKAFLTGTLSLTL